MTNINVMNTYVHKVFHKETKLTKCFVFFAALWNKLMIVLYRGNGTGLRKRIMQVSFYLVAFCIAGTSLYNGQVIAQTKDSTEHESEINKRINTITPLFNNHVLTDTLPLNQVQDMPYTYPGQMLNGTVPGINLLRPSGEPGVAPLVLLRGLSIPLGNYEDVFSNQPLYVVDGIPLIRNDHPYQLAIKEYDFNGIGSGIDISSLIDMNNVAKMEVVKGAEAVALYGVHAANGAIVITTKKPETGAYHVGLNIYGGVALEPPLNGKNDYNTINAAYQRDFELPFYQEYATPAEMTNFPAYLADSTSKAYFGPSNWNKLYYREALEHGADLNISGGTDVANFKFGVGEHTENGVADQTALKRYNVYYDMFIVPLKHLTIHTFAEGASATRNRNRSLRDRFAEMEYFPDQEYPLPPNKDYLEQYYSYVNEGIDKNLVNSIQALIHVQYDITKELSINSKFSVDYNDNSRQYFVPGALNDGNSFASYFSGINRRILWNNYASFNKTFSNNNSLSLQLGQSLEFDHMQYGYIKGYQGPSDFIKIIEIDVGSNVNVTNSPTMVYAYKDYLQQHLVSFYGHASYDLKHKYSATFSLRSDGSSYFGNGYYWAISPMLSLNWDLKEEPWLKDSHFFNALQLNVNGGRMARLPSEDYYGYGPYYTEDIGWNGSEKVSTYASFPTLNPPFSSGYVGGGIKWPYTNEWDVGLNTMFLKILHLSLHAYSQTGKNLLISIPTAGAAYGFSGQWLNGMSVRNSGIEVNLGGSFRLTHHLRWTSSIILQYNQSKLLSLPNGLQTLTDGNIHLEVGKPIDQFWLLQNEGIYINESQIPVSANGTKLSYNGIPFQAGDPIWKDVNHDGVIDDNDRVMEGHILPPIHGGWNNELQYKNWTLGFSILYSFGNDILNENVANRFNFANNEGVNGLAGVKEITFWEAKGNLNTYPRYNPWSLVNPYQTEQTLFYSKAGFVKLQSASLKYNLTALPFMKKSQIKQLQVYVTGTNLLMITPYNGDDPSLVNYFGYDDGYAEPLPPTFTVGINADF